MNVLPDPTNPGVADALRQVHLDYLDSLVAERKRLYDQVSALQDRMLDLDKAINAVEHFTESENVAGPARG